MSVIPSQSIFIGLFASLCVAALLGMASRGRPTGGRGVRNLVFPLYMRVLAAAFLPFAAFVCYAASKAHPSQATTASVVATCFVVGAVYLAVSVFCVRVYWTKEGIGSRLPILGHRYIPWGEVESSSYVPWAQAFRVSGGGRSVWYSPMQAGLGPLHRYMKRRLPHLSISEPPGRDREY